MLGLTWRPRASLQLAKLIAYVADHDAGAAARLREQIYQSIDFAREYPEAFRSGRRSGTREIVAHPNYIVIYRVSKTEIEVVSVLHARQKYP